MHAIEYLSIRIQSFPPTNAISDARPYGAGRFVSYLFVAFEAATDGFETAVNSDADIILKVLMACDDNFFTALSNRLQSMAVQRDVGNMFFCCCCCDLFHLNIYFIC